MAPYTFELEEENPAAMFQSLDMIAKSRKESENLTLVRTNSTSSSTSERRLSIPERIIVTEDGVVRAIETFGAQQQEEERGRKSSGTLRYYARFGERPIID